MALEALFFSEVGEDKIDPMFLVVSVLLPTCAIKSRVLLRSLLQAQKTKTDKKKGKGTLVNLLGYNETLNFS